MKSTSEQLEKCSEVRRRYNSLLSGVANPPLPSSMETLVMTDRKRQYESNSSLIWPFEEAYIRFQISLR